MWQIDALFTGKIARFTDTGETSAIAKHPVHGPVGIGFRGLEGDSQADLLVHGGPDKAIHHYPRDHYGWWYDRLPDQPLLTRAGAFGENVSTLGLTEDAICLGDRWRLGSALIEVSQGRQPCWKQGHRLSDPSIVARIVATRKCGWYYRVLEQGSLAAGDRLELTGRPHPQWDVARMFGLLIGGDGRDDPAALRALAGMDVLAAPWRRRAAMLLDV